MVTTNLTTVDVDGEKCFGVTLHLPKTKLMTILAPGVGYIMCGVLNVSEMDKLHPQRGIIAGRVIKVNDYEDMLEAEIESVTVKGYEIGIRSGILGKEALKIMLGYREE